ncbi:MAG: sulfatase [Planctomycetota bacterium]
MSLEDRLTRRQMLAMTAGAGAASLLGRTPAASAQPASATPRATDASRPNVLYVFADQWRRHALGCMPDADPVQTPHMDAFARQSLVLPNAIAGFPLCTPYRASLQTGLYPPGHGLTTNCSPNQKGLELGTEHRCIAEVFGDAGYHTAYFGKWHLCEPSVNRDPRPNDGAGGWDAFTPPGPRRQGWQHWFAYNAMDRHMRPHYWRDEPTPIEFDRWSPTVETDELLRYLRDDRDADRPFLAMVSWNPPHPPFIAPREFMARYPDDAAGLPRRANVTGRWPKRHDDPKYQRYSRVTSLDAAMHAYYAATTSIDHEFSRILAFLDEAGLADNTVVVITSDHGEMLGSHELMSKNQPYEESIGVPFVVRWPGRIAPRFDPLLMNTPDVYPTLAGLAGLQAADSVEGLDHSDHWLGKRDTCPGVTLIQGPRSPQNPAAGWRGVRSQNDALWTWSPRHDNPESVRYSNLVNDPYQLELANANIGPKPRVDELYTAMLDRLSATGDPAAQRLA